MTSDEASRLSTAVLECALKDAEGRQEGDRLWAIAWLSSRQASVFFDILGWEQSRILSAPMPRFEGCWMQWADEVLQEAPQTSREAALMDVIRTSRDYIQSLRA